MVESEQGIIMNNYEESKTVSVSFSARAGSPTLRIKPIAVKTDLPTKPPSKLSKIKKVITIISYGATVHKLWELGEKIWETIQNLLWKRSNRVTRQTLLRHRAHPGAVSLPW